MFRKLLLILVLTVMTLTSSMAMDPVRIAGQASSPSVKNITLDLTIRVYDAGGTPIRTYSISAVRFDGEGVFSFVWSAPEITYNPLYNVKIENSLNGIILFESRLDKIVLAQSQFGALITPDELNLAGEFHFTGDLNFGDTPADIITIDGTTTFNAPTTFNDIININGGLNLNGDPGIAGQVLTSQGADLPPKWEDKAMASDLTPGAGITGGIYNGSAPITFNLELADNSLKFNTAGVDGKLQVNLANNFDWTGIHTWAGTSSFNGDVNIGNLESPVEFVVNANDWSVDASGNAIFLGTISASNLSGTNTGDVTLGIPNGLSLSGQELSLGLASSETTGALSYTDWSTFNAKQDALTAGFGISIADDVITNTAPDQIVTLTGGGITEITGEYPNFTITSTEVDGIIGNEVVNATDATLTRSGLGTTEDPYTLALNLANPNTWTAPQTFTGASPLVFDGATVGGNTTTFVITDPTGMNEITFPDKSGTVALLSDLTEANDLQSVYNASANSAPYISPINSINFGNGKIMDVTGGKFKVVRERDEQGQIGSALNAVVANPSAGNSAFAASIQNVNYEDETFLPGEEFSAIEGKLAEEAGSWYGLLGAAVNMGGEEAPVILKAGVIGVTPEHQIAGALGVSIGETEWAGYFQGNVNVTGAVTAPTFNGDLLGNATSADKVNHTLTAGDGITGGTFDGSADATFAVDQAFPYNWTGNNTWAGTSIFNNTIDVTGVATFGDDVYAKKFHTKDANNTNGVEIGNSTPQHAGYIDVNGSDNNPTVVLGQFDEAGTKGSVSVRSGGVPKAAMYVDDNNNGVVGIVDGSMRAGATTNGAGLTMLEVTNSTTPMFTADELGNVYAAGTLDVRGSAKFDQKVDVKLGFTALQNTTLGDDPELDALNVNSIATFYGTVRLQKELLLAGSTPLYGNAATDIPVSQGVGLPPKWTNFADMIQDLTVSDGIMFDPTATKYDGSHNENIRVDEAYNFEWTGNNTWSGTSDFSNVVNIHDNYLKIYNGQNLILDAGHGHGGEGYLETYSPAGARLVTLGATGENYENGAVSVYDPAGTLRAGMGSPEDGVWAVGVNGNPGLQAGASTDLTTAKTFVTDGTNEVAMTLGALAYAKSNPVIYVNKAGNETFTVDLDGNVYAKGTLDVDGIADFNSTVNINNAQLHIYNDLGNLIVHSGSGTSDEGYLKTQNKDGNSTLVTIGSTMGGERGAVSVGYGQTGPSGSPADWFASMVNLSGFGLPELLDGKWMVGTGELMQQYGVGMFYDEDTYAGAIYMFNGDFTNPTMSVDNAGVVTGTKFHAKDANNTNGVEIGNSTSQQAGYIDVNNRALIPTVVLGQSDPDGNKGAVTVRDASEQAGVIRAGLLNDPTTGDWFAGVLGNPGLVAGSATDLVTAKTFVTNGPDEVALTLGADYPDVSGNDPVIYVKHNTDYNFTVDIDGNVYTAGNVKVDGTFAFDYSPTAVDGIVTAIRETSDAEDTKLPTEKAVRNAVDAVTLQRAYDNGLAATPPTRTINTTGGPMQIRTEVADGGLDVFAGPLSDNAIDANIVIRTEGFENANQAAVIGSLQVSADEAPSDFFGVLGASNDLGKAGAAGYTLDGENLILGALAFNDGENTYAGYFKGNVDVTGTLNVDGISDFNSNVHINNSYLEIYTPLSGIHQIVRAGAGHDGEGYLKTTNPDGTSTIVTLGATLNGTRGAVSVGYGADDAGSNRMASMAYLDATETGLGGTLLADKWMVGTGDLTKGKGVGMFYDEAGSAAALYMFDGSFTDPTMSVDHAGVVTGTKFHAKDANNLNGVEIGISSAQKAGYIDVNSPSQIPTVVLGQSDVNGNKGAVTVRDASSNPGVIRAGLLNDPTSGNWFAGVLGNTGLIAGSSTDLLTAKTFVTNGPDEVALTLGAGNPTLQNDAVIYVKHNTDYNFTVDIDGNTHTNGTLDVDGATTLNSTLDVDGATTLNSTLDVDGATTMHNTLDVTGVISGHDYLRLYNPTNMIIEAGRGHGGEGYFETYTSDGTHRLVTLGATGTNYNNGAVSVYAPDGIMRAGMGSPADGVWAVGVNGNNNLQAGASTDLTTAKTFVKDGVNEVAMTLTGIVDLLETPVIYVNKNGTQTFGVDLDGNIYGHGDLTLDGDGLLTGEVYAKKFHTKDGNNTNGVEIGNATATKAGYIDVNGSDGNPTVVLGQFDTPGTKGSVSVRSGNNIKAGMYVDANNNGVVGVVDGTVQAGAMTDVTGLTQLAIMNGAIPEFTADENGAVYAAGTLHVVGATNLDNILDVDLATTLHSTLEVTDVITGHKNLHLMNTPEGHLIVDAGRGISGEGYLKTFSPLADNTIVTLGATLNGTRGAVSVGYGTDNTASNRMATMSYISTVEFPALTGSLLANKWMVGTGNLGALQGVGMFYDETPTTGGPAFYMFNGSFTAPVMSVASNGDLKAHELMLNSGNFRVAEDGANLPWVNILKAGKKVFEIGLGTDATPAPAGYGMNVNDDAGNLRTGMGLNGGMWTNGVVGTGYSAGAVTSGGADAMLAVMNGNTPKFTANEAGNVYAAGNLHVVGVTTLDGNVKLGDAKNLDVTTFNSSIFLTDNGGNGNLNDVMISNGTGDAPKWAQIADANVATGAEIDVNKLADGAPNQVLITNVDGVTVNWSDNLDLPGTLDVTGASKLDATLTVDGISNFNADVKIDGAQLEIYDGSANLMVEAGKGHFDEGFLTTQNASGTELVVLGSTNGLQGAVTVHDVDGIHGAIAFDGSNWVAGVQSHTLSAGAAVNEAGTLAELSVTNDGTEMFKADQLGDVYFTHHLKTFDNQIIIANGSDAPAGATDVPWVNFNNTTTHKTVLEIGRGTDGEVWAGYGVKVNDDNGTTRTGMGYQPALESWVAGVSGNPGYMAGAVTSGAGDARLSVMAPSDESPLMGGLVDEVFYANELGNVYAAGTLHVVGRTDIDADLHVDGATYLNDNLDVDGNAQFDADVNIVGSFGFDDGQTVDGIVTTIADPGLNTNLPTEKAVRDAIDAVTLQVAYNNGLAADPATRTINTTTGGPIQIRTNHPDGGLDVFAGGLSDNAIDANIVIRPYGDGVASQAAVIGSLQANANEAQTDFFGVLGAINDLGKAGVAGYTYDGANTVLGALAFNDGATTYAGYFEGKIAQIGSTNQVSFAGNVDATNGLDVTGADFTVGGSALTVTTAGVITQTGTGQVTFTGNVDATNGLDVTNADLSVGGTNFTVTTAGNVTAKGTLDVTGITTLNNSLKLKGASNTLTFPVPALTADYSITFPTVGPTAAKQILYTTTTANGTMAWGLVDHNMIDLTDNYDWTGNHTFSKNVTLGDGGVGDQILVNNTMWSVDASGNAKFAGTVSEMGTSPDWTITPAGDATFKGIVNLASASTLTSVLGAMNVAGVTNFDDVTESTSTTTGAVIVDGGVGIAKNLNVGGAFTIAGTMTMNGDVNMGNKAETAGIGAPDDLVTVSADFKVRNTTVTPIDVFSIDGLNGNTTTNGNLTVLAGLGTAGLITLGDLPTGGSHDVVKLLADLTINNGSNNVLTVDGATGNTVLHQSATFSMRNSSEVDKFTVDGSSGATVIQGTLNVTGLGTFKGGIQNDGISGGSALTVSDDLNVAYGLTVNGLATFNLGASVTAGALNVSGGVPTSLGGTLTVGGDASLNAKLNVNGATTLQSTLGVYGAISNPAAGNMQLAINDPDGVNITGDVNMYDNVTIGVNNTDNLTVNSTTTMNNKVTLGKELILSNAVIAAYGSLATTTASVIEYTDATHLTLITTELPTSGVAGQILYILNNTANPMTIVGEPVPAGNIATMMFVGGSWRTVNMP